MSEPPRLTDPNALARNRARAGERLLHKIVRDEVEDRLALVNRSFHDVAVVSPFADVWTDFGGVCVPDAEVLQLQDSAHDLVVHAMCLHWANDPVGQLIQCRRALRPDGLFLGFCLGGRTLATLRAALAEAEIAATGGLSPRVAPMADIRDLGALLHRAGLALPVSDAFTQTLSYETPFHLMRDLRAMGEGNALAARLRNFTPRAILADAARRYPVAADGRIRAEFEIVALTGWAPDESQPKPLRPGSATARLADALGTSEKPLKD